MTTAADLGPAHAPNAPKGDPMPHDGRAHEVLTPPTYSLHGVVLLLIHPSSTHSQAPPKVGHHED